MRLHFAPLLVMLLSGCGGAPELPEWARVNLPEGPPAPAAAGRALLYGTFAEALAAGDLYAAQDMLDERNLSKPGAHLLKAAQSHRPHLLTELLFHGGKLTAKTAAGAGALHLAAAADDVYMIEHLVRLGMPLNLRDEENRTPLHWGAAEGKARALEALVLAGADLQANIREGVFSTPLQLAGETRQWKATEILWGLGAIYNIHHAAGTGDLKMVKRLMISDARLLENASAGGHTPLMTAVASDRPAVVQFLVESGANMLASTLEGDTAGEMAVLLGHQKMLETLITLGLPVNLPNPAHENKTLLHIAASSGQAEILKLLVKRGADVNATDARGETPLMAAVRAGDPGMTRALLRRGAVAEMRNTEGRAPLHLAAMQGIISVARALLELGAQAGVPDKEANTPLHLAAQAGHLSMIKLLLDQQAPVAASNAAGQTALHLAAASGQVDAVKLLVQRGADVDSKDRSAQTPLFAAVLAGKSAVIDALLEHGAALDTRNAQGSTLLHAAVQQGRQSIAQKLLERGLTLNLEDGAGQTPLFMAVQGRNRSIAEWVLGKGAQALEVSDAGATALDVAARSGNRDAMALLLHLGASPHGTEGAAKKPLHFAAESGDLLAVSMLLETGVDPRQADAQGRTALHHAVVAQALPLARYLIEQGVPVNSADAGGDAPLHLAAASGDPELVALLLERGADVGAVDRGQKTALDLAREQTGQRRSREEAPEAAVNRTRVAALLETAVYSAYWKAARGGDAARLEALTTTYPAYLNGMLFGKSPLHLASSGGHLDAVKLLLAKGAELEAVSEDSTGGTALYFAAEQGRVEAALALAEAGADMQHSAATGFTPVQAAMRAGHTDVVQALVPFLAPPAEPVEPAPSGGPETPLPE